ncbi:hypothetical protein [Neorhodopirellula pilleata]|nr:hypothetical protein [Neorhodopirellula pilleata]
MFSSSSFWIQSSRWFAVIVLVAGVFVPIAFGDQPGDGSRERTDLKISGVYPHLTTYGIYSQNGGHHKGGHEECGIGAIVPWADKLWMVNYAPHQPRGSEHKIFSVSGDPGEGELSLTVHPESVGGTPAGRMIHAESKQLLIAHYLIDEAGKVRVIPIEKMPIRVTAIARHLSDPANMVYYVDMEGSIWEANVHTLDVKRLFRKPVPGWHGKGGYTSQGRLVVSNNGEMHAGTYDDLIVGGPAKTPEERGVLAEYDGKNWTIIERRQYTEVTGPRGIAGGSDGQDPIWTMGWDRRSVRLKVLDNGKWHTYLLPKAAMCNDAFHGWYTEWPRIREITDGRWLMDMHGMFFDFPPTFSASDSAGLKPVASHLRYVPDFCAWRDTLVLASDETSIQGNRLAGQPQSNLWFGQYEDLRSWGPASGYGGPWIGDPVQANVPSDPFLIAGFDQRIVHLSVGSTISKNNEAYRATGSQAILSMSDQLAGLPRVTIERGNWRIPADGFEFTVDRPVTVYLAVDGRGEKSLASPWSLTELSLSWDGGTSDRIYQCDFPAGRISIPANHDEHKAGAFGMPHAAFVQSRDQSLTITTPPSVTVSNLNPRAPDAPVHAPVQFTLEIDVDGKNEWTELDRVEVADGGYVGYHLPEDLDATWLRLSANRDCIATASIHQTTTRFADPESGRELFAGLADVDATDEQGSTNGLAAWVYPAKRNRNLRVVGENGKHFEFTKSDFEWMAAESDTELDQLLAVEPEFTIDAASVVLKSRGEVLRLPKGSESFDHPFDSGWPRASREVESERHLANIHGTFYEVPLELNGRPPVWLQMRPVSSHSKQITDFCSWNGLLVLSGVRGDARPDDHVFIDRDLGAGLWFGGVDDLWKLGKPVGRGGPWYESKVQANRPSDRYLMTGYDHKTLTASADRDVEFTIEVDVDHQTGWHAVETIAVGKGDEVRYVFPPGFSAHWVRLVSDRDCVATAQFTYE